MYACPKPEGVVPSAPSMLSSPVSLSIASNMDTATQSAANLIMSSQLVHNIVSRAVCDYPLNPNSMFQCSLIDSNVMFPHSLVPGHRWCYQSRSPHVCYRDRSRHHSRPVGGNSVLGHFHSMSVMITSCLQEFDIVADYSDIEALCGPQDSSVHKVPVCTVVTLKRWNDCSDSICTGCWMLSSTSFGYWRTRLEGDRGVYESSIPLVSLPQSSMLTQFCVWLPPPNCSSFAWPHLLIHMLLNCIVKHLVPITLVVDSYLLQMLAIIGPFGLLGSETLVCILVRFLYCHHQFSSFLCCIWHIF